MENANDTLFQEALTHFPGGVSSPVRAFRAVGGTPKFFRKAWGARFEDEEGRRYVDLCMSWGPLILGHAVPEVISAAREAMEEGLTFGAPSRREGAPKVRPSSMASRAALSTSGTAWPRISGPQDMQRST